MLIELWNTNHLITIAGFLVIAVIFGLILKGKDSSVQKKVLVVISFIALALHFAKLFLPEYKELMPESIASVTFESIGAALVIMAPVILLTKNKIMKDFLFYMGLIATLFAIIYPLDVIGRELTEYEVIRYYLSNVCLFLVSFYMVFFGHHGLSLKRVLVFPLVFIVVECLILANEVILMEAGLVDFRGEAGFLEYNYRDPNFIFGPPAEFAEICETAVEPLVPEIFKTVKGGINAGSEKYIPIAWMIVPCYIYFTVISGLFCLAVTKVFKKTGDDF